MKRLVGRRITFAADEAEHDNQLSESVHRHAFGWTSRCLQKKKRHNEKADTLIFLFQVKKMFTADEAKHVIRLSDPLVRKRYPITTNYDFDFRLAVMELFISLVR